MFDDDPRDEIGRAEHEMEIAEHEIATLEKRTIPFLAGRIHENACNKGFHEYAPIFGVSGRDTRHILSWIALTMGELAEAAQAARKGTIENFGEELADTIIYVFDTAEALGIDIEQEIVKKMKINDQRSHMHGGKRA